MLKFATILRNRFGGWFFLKLLKWFTALEINNLIILSLLEDRFSKEFFFTFVSIDSINIHVIILNIYNVIKNNMQKKGWPNEKD